MITEYCTIEARNIMDLDQYVTANLEKGWKLYGPPTQTVSREDMKHVVLMQAMTLDEDDCK